MRQMSQSTPKMLSRASLLAGAVSATVAAAALPASAADSCHIGPPDHVKGPPVFMDYDQVELDAAYDQTAYSPLQGQILSRMAANSALMRARLGDPLRLAYGPTEIEKLDIYRARQPHAPIFVYIHGGRWLNLSAAVSGFMAEPLLAHGATFVALDFISVDKANGDLGVMADQVRRAVAWIWKNAATFGGDADRLYVGGHSSGGHLSGVVQVTDWPQYGLPVNAIKGGICASGLYELAPVRLSARSNYIKFTDAMVEALSSQRHIDRLRAPLVVTYGTNETPEFQRQNREFAAAVKAAGKSVQLVEATGYNHFEMAESYGNPYGPNGRAALKLMGLS